MTSGGWIYGFALRMIEGPAIRVIREVKIYCAPQCVKDQGIIGSQTKSQKQCQKVIITLCTHLA
jgi:hypothetical protein